MESQSNEGTTVGSRRRGAWLFLSKSPLRCPSLVPSPPDPPSSLCHLPLLRPNPPSSTLHPSADKVTYIYFFIINVSVIFSPHIIIIIKGVGGCRHIDAISLLPWGHWQPRRSAVTSLALFLWVCREGLLTASSSSPQESTQVSGTFSLGGVTVVRGWGYFDISAYKLPIFFFPTPNHSLLHPPPTFVTMRTLHTVTAICHILCGTGSSHPTRCQFCC